MLYSFTAQNELRAVPKIPGLQIVESSEPLLLSVMANITLSEARDRLLNDNRAYVAYVNDVPAAFGWMALGKARIGELNQEFIVPMNEAYLWNFRTLESFRGMGIYTHLLRFILLTEHQKVNRFWIIHAPENKASERGIIKAGFEFVGRVSVIEAKTVFANENKNVDEREIANIFGLDSAHEAACCWNCSSPYLTKRKPECCCLTHGQECTHSLYV